MAYLRGMCKGDVIQGGGEAPGAVVAAGVRQKMKIS